MSSNGEIARDTQMAAHHVDEQRIALGSPDGSGLTENPKQETGEPQPQAETKSCGKRMATARGAPPSKMCSVSAR
jgi:hypothetical protein